jgi:single-strand DNA-binding protein
MKMGINKVTLVGHVGDDPKMRETKDKLNVANFRVATNEVFRDREGKEIQKTEWHTVVAWDKKAELIKEYVKKGDPLYVEGRLRTSTWEDKEGVKRYSTEVFCDNFIFLAPAKNE